ncbi:MAG: lipocalin-like domain-containing protein [Candidatus Hodarchaeota archaeon]
MGQDYTLIPYRESNHGTFDEEWSPHKKTSGWWYITGYLADKQNPEHLYSYQYTVAQGQVFGKSIYILHIGLTDLQENKHFFKQGVRLRRGKNVRANQDTVIYAPHATLSKEQKQFKLSINLSEFDLDLLLQKGKDAFWHCDNGVLVMGLPDDPKQRTVYYSYTNLPTEGTLTIQNKSGQTCELEVVGKSWFDRQYGPFRLLDPDSHWEWFSFRFFDDEEIMLFSFPRHPYSDGTYIDKQGQTTRLQNYEIKPKDFIKKGGNNHTFSFGWDVNIPGIKEEKYEINPLTEGQFNIAYFELLAEVLNTKKERVGYCFVELISGARNKLSLRKQIGDLRKKGS